jgi:hypothetical protein
MAGMIDLVNRGEIDRGCMCSMPISGASRH